MKVLRTVRRGKLVDFEALENRRLLATVDWIAAGGGDWNNGANWSSGNVPGPNDNAVINLPGSPQILIDNAPATVQSVTSTDPISISSNGSLTVSSSSTISGGLTMTGGSITATGPGTTFTVSGTTSISAASLSATGGADLSLPNLTNYINNNNSNSVVLDAIGSGSVLNLSNLIGFDDQYEAYGIINVEASNGGSVVMSSVANIINQQFGFSPVNFISSGADSSINLSSLTSLVGPWGYSFPGDTQANSISVTNGGSIIDPKLTNLNNVNVTVDGTGSLSTDLWTNLSAGQINIEGGAYDLSSLTYADGSSFYVTSGATLDIPNLTNFGGSNADSPIFNASGSGSVLDLPSLSSVDVGSPAFLAAQGGRILINALTKIDAQTYDLNNHPYDYYQAVIQADGAGSEIQMNGAVELGAASLSNSTSLQLLPLITISNGGTITAADLTTIGGSQVLLDGGNLIAGNLSTLSDGRLLIESGSYTIDSLTNVDDSIIEVESGSMLILPDVVDYAASVPSPMVQATKFMSTGPGSILDLADLSSISLNQILFSIVATNGGTVQVNKLTNVDISNDSSSSFSIEADGENSAIDAPNLSSIKGYVYSSSSVLS